MKIDSFLQVAEKHGFIRTSCSIRQLYVFHREGENGFVDLCFFIDQTTKDYITPETVEQLRHRLEDKLSEMGYLHVNYIYMICSDNPEREKSFLNQNTAFWILDTIGKRIMIFDEQPEDFCDMKAGLEEALLSNSFSLKNIPRVTAALILINLLCFLPMLFQASDDFISQWASNWKCVYEEGEYYRLFTSMFLHFNLEHLMNNMLSLAFLGAIIERSIGSIRFCLIYLGSGLGGSFLSTLYYMKQNTDAFYYSAGASGAVYGILGALLVLVLIKNVDFHRLKPINLLILAFLFISDGFFSTENIDNFAHIGGFITGMLITFLSCLYKKNVLK